MTLTNRNTLNRNNRKRAALAHSMGRVLILILLVVSVSAAVCSGLIRNCARENIRNAYFEGETIRISRYSLDLLQKTNHISDPEDCFYLDNHPKHLTSESIENLSRLQLSARCAGDLDFLTSIQKIHTLIINEAEYLTATDLENIGRIGAIGQLTLSYDFYYLLMHPALDLHAVSINTEHISIVCRNTKKPQMNDISAYVVYSLLIRNGFSKEQIPASVNKPEWRKEVLDLAATIRQRQEDDPDTNKANLLEFATCLIYEQITYDEAVKDIHSDDNEIAFRGFKLADSYNTETLGSIFRQQSPRTGICCNYAALENIVLYELGVPCFYAYGPIPSATRKTAYHAWIFTQVGQDYYICDPTNNLIAKENDLLRMNDIDKVMTARELYHLNDSQQERVDDGLFEQRFEKEEVTYVEPIPYSGYRLTIEEYQNLLDTMKRSEMCVFLFVEAALICAAILTRRKKSLRKNRQSLPASSGILHSGM